MVHQDGTTEHSGETFGYYVLTQQYFQRYHLPVLHTKTNCKDAAKAPHWLRKEWQNIHRLKLDGVPILGFTWTLPGPNGSYNQITILVTDDGSSPLTDSQILTVVVVPASAPRISAISILHNGDSFLSITVTLIFQVT